MRLGHLRATNYARLQDLDVEIRQHLVVVGANDVGKTSLLRLLNLTLAAPLGLLYQSLSRSDLRDESEPLTVEAVLIDFSDEEQAVFYREIDVEPVTGRRTLTVRLEVTPSVDDPEAVDIRRVLTGTAEQRPPTREQLLALGWRYLPATRGAGAAQLDGPNSALRVLLDGIDMGDEKTNLAAILLDFNDKLHTSEKLSELRGQIAQHLAKSMPRAIAGDDLAVRTAADPADSAPILPVMPTTPSRMTHDYIRHETTSLFAALDISSGSVIAHHYRRHRHQEFLRFLKLIDKAVPKELDLHLVLDNYATHKTPAVKNWLIRHPRLHPHFTPTSSSWMNLVERWFAELTTRKLRRSAHRSVTELEKDVRAWINEWNKDPKPFVWTKTADDILETLAAYCQRINDSGH